MIHQKVAEIGNIETEIKNKEVLSKLIDKTFLNLYAETWIKHADISSLCILTNKKSVFLMFLNKKTNSCFSSRNANLD